MTQVKVIPQDLLLQCLGPAYNTPGLFFTGTRK